jgi:hypothetical protein
VDLGALAEHPGELVRVGGLVVAATAGGFRLDDGTAVGTVTLAGDAAAYLGLLEPGDAVNAVGRVVRAPAAGGRADDSVPWTVLVTDPGGLLRVGDLGEPQTVTSRPADAEPGGAGDPGPAVPGVQPGGTGRLGLDSALAELASPAGVVSLALMTALSLASAVVRRRRAEALRTRLEGRVERYAGTTSVQPP